MENLNIVCIDHLSTFLTIPEILTLGSTCKKLHHKTRSLTIIKTLDKLKKSPVPIQEFKSKKISRILRWSSLLFNFLFVFASLWSMYYIVSNYGLIKFLLLIGLILGFDTYWLKNKIFVYSGIESMVLRFKRIILDQVAYFFFKQCINYSTDSMRNTIVVNSIIAQGLIETKIGLYILEKEKLDLKTLNRFMRVAISADNVRMFNKLECLYKQQEPISISQDYDVVLPFQFVPNMVLYDSCSIVKNMVERNPGYKFDIKVCINMISIVFREKRKNICPKLLNLLKL